VLDSSVRGDFILATWPPPTSNRGLTPAFVRNLPEQRVLAVAGVVHHPEHDSYAEFLGRAYSLLGEATNHLAAEPSGPAGALYPPKLEGDSETVVAFVPVDHPELVDDRLRQRGVVNQTLPAVTCAVLAHAGSYATMGATYRRLGAWVSTNAVPADLSVREIYVVAADNDGQLLPDDQLLTEICWPIVARTEP
jgi:effector-binding domain-containing protein